MPDQAGRRPSNPSYLAFVGVIWIVCGIVALVKLSASWKFIPAIFFVGVGLLFLRGAAVTLSRRGQR